MLWLERLDQARAPLDPAALAAALDAAFAPPHPWVIVSDEWGSMLRLEAAGAAARLEARKVSSEGVAWFALGVEEAPGTQTTLHLAGRTVKVAPTEILRPQVARDAVSRFVAGDGAPPEELSPRPMLGDHGRLFMVAVAGEEPRPAMGWADIARRLQEVDAGSVMGALSEPGRVLIGVFGAANEVTVSVQESRGPRTWSRRLEQLEGGGSPKTVSLPTGALTVPAKQVLSRADAWTVVESLYRFDVPPPGFGWVLSPS